MSALRAVEPAPSVPPPRTPLIRAARLAAFGAAVAALAAAGVPLCPVAVVARVPCPGCGLTRATIALLHGHLDEAVRLHPLTPVVAPLFCGFLAYACAVYVRRGRWPGATGHDGGDPQTPGPAGAEARWIAIAGIAVWTLLVGVWLARFHGAFGGPVPV